LDKEGWGSSEADVPHFLVQRFWNFKKFMVGMLHRQGGVEPV